MVSCQYGSMTIATKVNGQTGKLVGTAPISKAKVWAYAGTLGVTLAAILCMVNAIASLV